MLEVLKRLTVQMMQNKKKKAEALFTLNHHSLYCSYMSRDGSNQGLPIFLIPLDDSKDHELLKSSTMSQSLLYPKHLSTTPDTWPRGM